MGRSVDQTTKGERLQIRISVEDREKFETARLIYMPRVPFQSFLECIDRGLALLEAEHLAKNTILKGGGGSGSEFGRQAINE
jgi:hypothetical protein